MVTTNNQTPTIKMENINKRFGKVNALDDVSFELAPGEIRALVGENGAGKSTLMNILYGMYHQDGGNIYVNDEKVSDKWSPNLAIAKGIGMIHQHFSLVNNHTVLENIVMPTLKWNDFTPEWKKHEEGITKLLNEYHFSLNLKDIVESISIGERQQVEILKALYQGAKILILDEPTGVLTPQQGEALLNFLVDIRKKGYSVVLVTHNLNEAMRISDRITVLRGGKHIGLVETSKTTIPEIAHMMVEREIYALPKKQNIEILSNIVEIKNVTVENENKKVVVDNVNLTIGKGEIVGVAGVAGNGQIELAEAIVGLRPLKNGTLIFNSKDISQWDVQKRRYAGIGFISEDRHEKGMVGNMTIAENLIIDCMRKKPFSKGGIMQHKNIKKYGNEVIDNFNIKAMDCLTPIKNLSGGNQQKVVLARTLMESPKLLVACQPTRGLDFSATEYMHRKLLESAQNNVGILVISSDLDELFELSDRIIVMCRGKVMGIVKREEIGKMNLVSIGLMMTGTPESEIAEKTTYGVQA